MPLSPRPTYVTPQMTRRTFITKASLGAGVVALPAAVRSAGAISTGRIDAQEQSTAGIRVRYLVQDPAFVHSRPGFSPTGERVLFMRAPATDNPISALNSNDSPWSLWTVPVAGGPPALLFEHPEIRATRPAWSHQTGWIAFSGVRAGASELWLIDGEGNNLTRVPVQGSLRDRLFYPSWYPSGDAVAITDYRRRQVLRVDISSGAVQPLSDPTTVLAGMCSVSPDPQARDLIAYAGQRPGGRFVVENNSIWIQFPGRDPYELDGQQGRMPSWSPDGSRIAFASTRGRRAPSHVLHPRTLPSGVSTIFVQRAAESPPSSPPTGVSPFGIHARHAKWSSTGRQLVCMALAPDSGSRGIILIEVED